jgi:hemolysin III
MMNQLQRYFEEPVNTLTHLLAAVFSLGGLIWLIVLTWDEPGKMVSLAIYGISLVLLYTASTLLHGAKLPEEKRMGLNRLDHAAIFVLIAGTYTPIAYNLFPPGWRWLVLAIVWLLAAVGVANKFFAGRIHGLLQTSIYPLMGWGGAVPAVFAHQQRALIPPSGLLLILLGGLIFTAGYVIYYRQRPDPWPGVFGHHEIWHLFVIAGSLCHFLFMFRYVVPA